MSFESDLYSALGGNATLSNLVGGRIVPSHAGQGTAAPYVVYTPIFNDARYDLDGDTGVAKVRLQVDCYAEDPEGADQAAAIARAVIEALPETGWPLHRTAHSNQDLGLEAGTRLFRRLLEFSVFHRG